MHLNDAEHQIWRCHSPHGSEHCVYLFDGLSLFFFVLLQCNFGESNAYLTGVQLLKICLIIGIRLVVRRLCD